MASGQPRVSTNAPYDLFAVERPATVGLGQPQVPALTNPTANPLPAPSSADPFGFGLEFDGESPVPGGPPTQPKNLRFELIANNWAEINWAPSNDDGEVVQYTIRRDDGVEYIVRGDQTDDNSGAQAEINKYWSTTSFIDCNFTRFDQLLHACGAGNQPIPGTTYIYTVTAVDNAGQESAASDPLTITYFLDENGPVPRYDDLDRDSSADNFVETTDLSAVEYFLDERFQLVFQDEFNGDSLDLERWQTQLTFGPETIINDEKQIFVNTQDPDLAIQYDPFTFTGSSLIIEAIPTPDSERANLPAVCDTVGVPEVEQCDFLSGALSSFDRYGFLYGYTEGRFKVSEAAGALSSFFLFHRFQGTGTSFHAPEIDILEYLGENPFGDEFAFQTYHYESPNQPSGTIVRSVPTMFDPNEPSGLYADGEFHTFGVLWEPQLVIWYIDGVEVIRMFGPQVSRRPMNIVNYLVTGSSWAPTPDVTNEALFPIQFEVDYIRVYQRDQFVDSSSYGITR